jgi:hypothetical protein
VSTVTFGASIALDGASQASADQIQTKGSGGGNMAIQKKSLIGVLKTAKKANIASAQPPEIVTPEALDGKNLKSMTRLSAKKSARGLNMRHAKKNLRSLKKG